MITIQEILEQSKARSILEEERKARMELSAIRSQILKQLAEKAQQREKNFGNVKVGDLIESSGNTYEVVKVESSYVTVVNESGELQKKWLHECKVVGSTKNNKVQVESGQIRFKSYLSKHLNADLVEAIRRKSGTFNNFLLMSFLTNYDKMIEATDLEKQKRLVEQVFKYMVKLNIPANETINALDDKMIYEAAQGNIVYSAPNKLKIKSLLESLGVDSDNNKYNNEIVKNLQQMIKD